MNTPITEFDRDDLISSLQQYVPSADDDSSSRDGSLAFVLGHPDFYKRSQLSGHVTASAWVVDERGSFVLLNHHRSLDRWMQLGGHIEADRDIRSAALREASEESGLKSIRLARPEVFDIDIHTIPTSSKAPEHQHYDIRFLITADRSEPITISSESKSLVWVPLDEVSKYTSERSVLRMVEKTARRAE